MSLQGLRNASEQMWAKLLMGILIFSFVGWGAASWLLNDTAVSSSLVRIGSETVNVSDFEAERNRQLAQMSKEMQKQIYTDKRTQNYFNQQTLNNMATRMMLEQHAENLGLVVSPTAVANIIKSSPEFWEDGSFSTDKFDAVLDMNGITEKYFADVLRRQELREMLLGSLNTNLPIPDFMTDAVYNTRYAMRKIEYSTIKFDAFSVAGKPTEDDLREVYAKNPKMVPEYRTISYIIVGAKMNVPDSYDRGYEAARSIEDMLVAGDTMKDAAKKMRATYRTFEPMTIQKRIANGSVGDPVLTDEMMKNLFAMEQGLESEIIEAKNGFVIFRVEKIDPAHAVPFGRRRGELTALWRKSEQEKQAYARANEILTSGRKLAVTATVGRANGAPLEVLNAAFSGELNGGRIVPGNAAFHIVRVIEEIPAKPGKSRRKAIAAELKDALPRQILDDYTNFLNRKYKVSTNEKMMRRLFQ
ncbi:MAG: SurA N-terminal domain-containing protein [Rickettsiales bacterium]|jgi:peptidyl-prolyl cis-trans isomerase D|nr:SurA N-terminal domain-containing protein [Rickettsiales bacterium]